MSKLRTHEPTHTQKSLDNNRHSNTDMEQGNPVNMNRQTGNVEIVADRNKHTIARSDDRDDWGYVLWWACNRWKKKKERRKSCLFVGCLLNVPATCECISGTETSLFVGWLLNVPATYECISGTDLHRQFYVLSH